MKALRKLGFGNILGEEIKQEILSTPTKQQQQSVNKIDWTFEPFSPEKRKFKKLLLIVNWASYLGILQQGRKQR